MNQSITIEWTEEILPAKPSHRRMKHSVFSRQGNLPEKTFPDKGKTSNFNQVFQSSMDLNIQIEEVWGKEVWEDSFSLMTAKVVFVSMIDEMCREKDRVMLLLLSRNRKSHASID